MTYTANDERKEKITTANMGTKHSLNHHNTPTNITHTATATINQQYSFISNLPKLDETVHRRKNIDVNY